MLKKLRHKKTAKKVWIILAVLIVPAFVFWGFGGALREKQESGYVGIIFGKKISLLEYKDALAAVKNQAIMQFGDNLPEIQKYLDLNSQAWERLLLLAEAKKRKIKAGNEEVVELIRGYSFFQRKGQFDEQIYVEMLKYFRTPPRIFEEQARQNLILSKLYRDVTDEVTLTEEEIKEEYRKNNEEISIYYLAAMLDEFTKDATPGEDELKEYFVNNSPEFKEPLSFNLEYIQLDSEEKIKDILSRLNKKNDFVKVAKDFGASLKETGFFSQTDSIPGIGWSAEILSLIPKLKVGHVLPAIRLDKYYYILRLKQRREPYIPDFEIIKEKARELFIKKKAGERAKERIEDCLKKLKGQYKINPESIDFDRTAKDYGLKSGSTQFFKYGSYIEGIGASDNLWVVAQKLKDDELSEIIDMGQAGFYIIKVKSKIPVDNAKFASEKADFSQKLLAQKKQGAFTTFVEGLRKRAQRF